MPETTPQSYANHSRLVPGFHFATFTAIVLCLLYALYNLFRFPSVGAGFGLLQAGALVGLFWYCRIFPLKAQDRVIRLEEQLRLSRLLPADLAAAATAALTPGQLIALRFAADGEVADLVRRIQAGELATPAAIKQAIKTWRPDYLRV
jgi:hypothetical protein